MKTKIYSLYGFLKIFFKINIGLAEKTASIMLISFMSIPLLSTEQTLSPQVVSTGGGNYQNSNNSFSVNIGEIAVQTYENANNSLTQGFEQPIELVVLPVSLISFTATLVNRQTNLQWTTAQEFNNSYFDVERSKDGSNFLKLTTIKGQGNSSVQNTYNAIDPSPFNDITYYRLKQVDFDGNFTYSPVVFVKLSEGYTYLIYPNPATNSIYINIVSESAQQMELSLYDMSGKRIETKELKCTSGNNQFEWDISSLAKGTYMIGEANNEVPVMKIVKE